MVNVPMIISFVVAVTIPLLGGYLPSMFLRDEPNSPWYQGLNKAPWNPPNWAFPVVWTFLFVTMGIASWLVYNSGDGFSGAARVPLILYIVQLLVNIAWTPVFFGAHLIVVGTLHIIFLTLLVAYTAIRFYSVHNLAGLLLVPYIGWLTLASSLMIYIWTHN